MAEENVCAFNRLTSGSFHHQKATGVPKRICVLEDVDSSVIAALNESDVEFERVDSSSAVNLAVNETSTLFVLQDFSSNLFDIINKTDNWILGPTAVIELCSRKLPLLPRRNPVYCLSMDGFLFFIAIKDKQIVVELMKLIRFMGGSVRAHLREMTYYISNDTLSSGYRYATTYNIPVMTPQWIESVWGKRNLPGFKSSSSQMGCYKLKPFTGLYICFLHFSSEEHSHRVLLQANNGIEVELQDPRCTHAVVEDFKITEEGLEEVMQKCLFVHSEWFWTCIQQECRVAETNFTFKAENSPESALDSSIVLRSRNSLDKNEHIDVHIRYSIGGKENTENGESRGVSPGRHSFGENSTRESTIRELVETECNYIKVLETILKIRNMAADEKQIGGPLINKTEVKLVFRYFEEITVLHKRILADLETARTRKGYLIADVFVKYKEDLMAYYPRFSNRFEDAQRAIRSLELTNPRFKAFLEIWKNRPECGREQLKELLMRPIQRLGSVVLLLKEIQKTVPQDSLDNRKVQRAIDSVEDVMRSMNDDLVRTEKLCSVFYVFDLIQNCPVTLVSSHRCLLIKFIGQDLTGTLSSQGDCLVFFVFSDVLEVCRMRKKIASLVLSGEKRENVLMAGEGKPYKHIELMSLCSVRRVVNIIDTPEVKNSFALVIRQTKVKDTVCCFRYMSQDVPKEDMITRLAKYLAQYECSGDVNKYWISLFPHETDGQLQTSEIPIRSGVQRFFSNTVNALSPRNPGNARLTNVFRNFNAN